MLLYENYFCITPQLHTLINKDSHKKQVCRRCLTAFSAQGVLNDHMKRCLNQNNSSISFPKSNCFMFNDYYMKIPIPFRVYAHFECNIQPHQNETIKLKTLNENLLLLVII